MPAFGPDPRTRYPLEGQTSMVFLRNTVSNPQIEVGDYTYYHDFADPLGFERNVHYLFPFENDRLIIGRFCAIAARTTFLMNGANHSLEGPSTYPFGIFGHGWEAAMPERWPTKGDLVIGHDVWIGYGATLLAGITVGHGAVVGAMSVVASDVPAYAVVAGNPARVVRHRQPAHGADILLSLAWWDWPIERITEHVALIAGGDAQALAQAAARDRWSGR